MRVYLGGPINGCTDEEASGWREAVKNVLAAAGCEWSDPMDRDYRGRELEPGVAADIVSEDIIELGSCDIALMNCARPSWGTAMEIVYATQARIRVVVVLPDEGCRPSPWLLWHSDEILRGSMEQAAKQIVSR